MKGTADTISTGYRVFLAVGAFLVFASAVSLFIFSEQTEVFFAWTINPPLTAAFLGAGYAGVTLALGLGFRQRDWLRVRVGTSVLITALTLILLATLLHLDRFHLSSPNFFALLWAWAWLILYIGLIPGLLIALWMQRRVRVGPEARVAPLAPWLRFLMLVLGATLLLIGAGLFLLPGSVSPLWAWPLTPLTSRMIGAWLCSIGVSLLSGAYEDDYPRVYLVGATYIAYATLQFINLVRYPGTITWSQSNIWMLIILLGAMLITGIASVLGYLALAPAQRASA